MSYKTEYPGIIHFEQKNHVVYLRFDNPKSLNAISDDTVHSLDEIFTELTNDEDVWGVIITGTGKAFVSGADLSGPKQEMNLHGPVYLRRELRREIHEVFEKIQKYPRPVICAINGYALGGGAEIALCADFRIASTNARIGFPENKLGLFPGFGGPSRMIHVLGVTAAKEMLYTGDFFTADQAKELGFVSQVVDADKLMEAAEAFMDRILCKAPIATKYIKIMVDRGMEMSHESCLEFERMTNLILTTTEDYQEGMSAFYEKRTPQFKNR